MNKIVPIISFGIGIIAIGITWALYDEARTFFTPYIIDGASYQLQYLFFRMMPIVALLVGIMALIYAGTKGTQRTGGGET